MSARKTESKVIGRSCTVAKRPLGLTKPLHRLPHIDANQKALIVAYAQVLLLAKLSHRVAGTVQTSLAPLLQRTSADTPRCRKTAQELH